MSLDDMCGESTPTLCDSCSAKVLGGPQNGVGWKLMVFTCRVCKRDFCPCLVADDRPGTACVDCGRRESSE